MDFETEKNLVPFYYFCANIPINTGFTSVLFLFNAIKKSAVFKAMAFLQIAKQKSPKEDSIGLFSIL